MVVICVLLSYILGNFFNTNIKILKDKFLKLAQYSSIFKESSLNQKKYKFDFINHDKYSEIKFKEDLLKNTSSN